MFKFDLHFDDARICKSRGIGRKDLAAAYLLADLSHRALELFRKNVSGDHGLLTDSNPSDVRFVNLGDDIHTIDLGKFENAVRFDFLTRMGDDPQDSSVERRAD